MQSLIYHTHILVIIIAILSALILPNWAVLLLISIHLLHTYLFNGCLLTKLARHYQPSSQNFFQEFFTKTFNLHPTTIHTSGITWLVYILTLSLNHLPR